MKRLITIVFGLFSIFALISCGGSGGSGSTTFTITGRVTAVGDKYGKLVSPVNAGDTLVMTFTLDNSVKDTYPDDTTYGDYLYHGPSNKLSIKVGQTVVAVNPSAANDFSYYITIAHSSYYSPDAFTVQSMDHVTSNMNIGSADYKIVLSMSASPGTGPPGDKIPHSPPDLTKYTQLYMGFTAKFTTDPDYDVQVGASVDSIEIK